MKQDIYHRPIDSHGGGKYLRAIVDATDGSAVRADVYAVLRGFAVTCPAIQQAVKKLLCAGLRGKGSRVQDLKEAMDALFRGIQFAEQDEAAEKAALDELKNTCKGKVTELPGGGVAISYKVENVNTPPPQPAVQPPAYLPCPKCESPKAADKSCSVCGYGSVQEAKP